MADAFELRGPAEIIAHRGYSARAPENTLAAMELALDVGADAIEFDLQTARDGTPFLFHDDRLDRTTDARGRIHDRAPAELAGLDAGSWFDPAFAGEPVPDLRSTLERLRDREPRVYAEIKGYRDLAEVDGIVEIFADAGFLARTVFISMKWAALDRIRVISREAAVGYIVKRASWIEEALERAAGDPRAMLDYDARILLGDPARARRARRASIELAAWTVDRVEDAARLLEMGVPRITTNEVEALLRWKATL